MTDTQSMKPFTQNLIACFIGALIATVLVLLFGILWIGDDEGSNDSEQEKTDVMPISMTMISPMSQLTVLRPGLLSKA